MGILSSSVSVTRYRVQGKLEAPVVETVEKVLKTNGVKEIDGHAAETAAGWTSFQNPYRPSFEGASFVFGTYLVFALRIDKKSIPAKIVSKHYAVESARKLEATGRDFLTRNEKKMIKDHVVDALSMRIPATPNIFDVLWNYEGGSLWFFSNLKSANEEFETLFSRSFNLPLIRTFPYTSARLGAGLKPPELDALAKLAPAKFKE